MSAVATVVLPMVLGGITNELLANVGLFVLLALGSISWSASLAFSTSAMSRSSQSAGTPPQLTIAELWRVGPE